MSDILSQDEVDALLKGVDSGDIETESKKQPESGVKPYDLTSQERVIRGRMQGLDVSNDRFSKTFRNSISGLLMRFVDISVAGVETVRFGDFMKTIPVPSSINIFKMNPLKGYSLLVVEAPLVFGLVEFFFGGGTNIYVKSEGRSFTPIENMVIKKIVKAALGDLVPAWDNILQVSPEYIGSEMNPQFVNIVGPNEIVVKIEMSMEVEDFKGRFFFCLPYSMLEPVKEKIYFGIQREKFEIDKRWVKRIKEILLDSRVEVVAELGSTMLAFEEIMRLEPGSVIKLGKSVTDELEISVEGVPKFTGSPGHSKGNQAVRIVRILENEQGDDVL
ncbi:MAG: flagellar motor switch protein FliM [Nitrospiraceae bacterium]|nr:flagellar motor switch protein FliM [Nitrospiraceae bacterium]